MKNILFILFLLLSVQSVDAQPAARRQATQQKKTNADNVTQRALISFPTAQDMSEDVVWRRDIYRILNLEDDANAGLYYPVEPIGSQMNLFTYIFKLMMVGNLKVYEYKLDGNENFDESAVVKPLTFLDNYHIFYERVNGRIKLDNSDIPSAEVKSYYIKETSYFDQASGTFHTKVLALCPVLSREDDFGDGATKYPLFWVKYDDLAPFLSKQIIMTSNLNNAATMSMDDYFTSTLYRGKIYKTNNMLGKTLAQYCPTDEAMQKEQQRIEKELLEFESGLWGDKAAKDSLDSIAKLQKVEKKKTTKTARSSSTATKTVKEKKAKAPSSSSSAGQPRVSVRRQRH